MRAQVLAGPSITRQNCLDINSSYGYYCEPKNIRFSNSFFLKT